MGPHCGVWRFAVAVLCSGVALLAAPSGCAGGGGATPEASLSLSPALVDLGQTATSAQLALTQRTGSPLGWTIAADRSWVTVDPAAGAGTGAVTVRVQRAGLGAGSHRAALTVAWPGGSTRAQVSLTQPGGVGQGDLPDGTAYDMGAVSDWVDLYVAPGGDDDDANPGTGAARPLATLLAARARMAGLGAESYRVNMAAGTYPFDDLSSNAFVGARGTREHPILIQPASPGSAVVIQGGLNLIDCGCLYLLDLRLEAGGAARAWGNNVLHVDGCDQVLLRGLTVTGLVPSEFQEVIKANQCTGVYIENCDVGGAYQVGIDLFSVQYAQVLHSRIHDTAEWGMYAKGGSAYLRVDGNDFEDCGMGFQAGEGSNLEVMREPWVHYETYDVKFVNNTLRNIPGTGLSVAGSYNVLLAHNTLYRVGTFDDGSGTGYALLQLVHGARSCVDTDENGVGNAHQICEQMLDDGAWGTSVVGADAGGEWIPSRNVRVLNNVFLNPVGTRTLYSHLVVHDPIAPPGSARNIPSPSRADQAVTICANLIWNGPADMPLGLEGVETLLSASQILSENRVNLEAPQLANPEVGDLRPSPGGNVDTAEAVVAPDFSWSDAPTTPSVPAGRLSNAVPLNHDGVSRGASARPGAY